MSAVNVPGVPEVRAYLGESASVSEKAITEALAAERSDQAARCRVDPYNDSLANALKRRVAHNLAMKNLPLGVSMDEFGSTRISSTDPEVRRFEAPYRRVTVG